MAVLLGNTRALAAEMTPSPPLTAAQTLAEGENHFRLQRRNETYEMLLPLVSSPASQTGTTAEQVARAFDLLINTVDTRKVRNVVRYRLMKDAIKCHPDNWRIFQLAADQLSDMAHWGFDGGAGGDFYLRTQSTGKWDKHAAAVAMNRVQSLMWMRRASELALADASAQPGQKGEQLLKEAAMWIRDRKASDLVNLTDISSNGFSQVDLRIGGEAKTLQEEVERDVRGMGYPVDESGQPVYFKIPASWEVATNDGERWRFLLHQAAAVDPALEVRARVEYAAKSMFRLSMTAMALQGGVMLERPLLQGEGAEPELSEEMKEYDPGSLGDDETIAALSSGVRRFTLPEEHRFIEILKRAGATDGPEARDALGLLRQAYDERQQLVKAAAVQRMLDTRFMDSVKYPRISENPMVMLIPGVPQGMGKPATVEMWHRKVGQVRFKARKVRLKALFDAFTTKGVTCQNKDEDRELLKTLRQASRHLSTTGNQPPFVDLVSLFEAKTTDWKVLLRGSDVPQGKLEKLTTPLRQPGLYLVEASVAGGEVSRCMVEIAGLVVAVKCPVQIADVYGYLLDAETGQPVPNAAIRLFGSLRGETWEPPSPNDPPIYSEKLTTAEDGRFLIKKEKLAKYDLAILARAPDGRWALLSNEVLGDSFRRYTRTEEHSRAWILTDRLLYQPGETVKAVAWMSAMQTGRERPVPRPAGDEVKIYFAGESGTATIQQPAVLSETGVFQGEILPGAGAVHGKNSVFTNPSSGSMRVSLEEPLPGEYSLKIDAPSTVLKLGQSIAVRMELQDGAGSRAENAMIDYQVERKATLAPWYPSQRWDWLYGPGYWEQSRLEAKNESRGWENTRHLIHARHEEAQWILVARDQRKVPANGSLPITVKPVWDVKLREGGEFSYIITARAFVHDEVVAVERREVLAASQPARLGVWTDRGFYTAGDKVHVFVQAQTTGGHPHMGKTALRLIKTGAASRPDREIGWAEVSCDGEGYAKQEFELAEPGRYLLNAELNDPDFGRIHKSLTLLVQGPAGSEGILTDGSLKVALERPEYAPGEVARLLIQGPRPAGTVLVFPRQEHGGSPPAVTVKLDDQGYALFPLPVSEADKPDIFVEVAAVHQGQWLSRTVRIPVPPVDKFADVELQMVSGSGAVEVIAKTYNGVPLANADVVLTAHDAGIDNLGVAKAWKGTDIRRSFWGQTRSHLANTACSLQTILNGWPLSGGQARVRNEALKVGVILPEISIGCGGRPQREVAGMNEELTQRLLASQYLRKHRGGSPATWLWRPDLKTDSEGTTTVPLDATMLPEDWVLRAWVRGPTGQVGEAVLRKRD